MKIEKNVYRVIVFFMIMVGISLVTRFTATLTVPFVTTKKPSGNKLTYTITGEGKIEPTKYTYIFGESGFSVRDIYVKEGDYVEEGMTLLALNMEEIQTAYKRAKLNIAKLEQPPLSKESENELRSLEYKKEQANEAYDHFVETGELQVLEAKKDSEEAKEKYDHFLLKHEKDQTFLKFIKFSSEEILLLEQYKKAKEGTMAIKHTYDQLDLQRQKNILIREQTLEEARIYDIWKYFALLKQQPLEEEVERKDLKNIESQYKEVKKEQDALYEQIKKNESLYELANSKVYENYAYYKDLLVQYETYKKDYELKLKTYEQVALNYERDKEVAAYNKDASYDEIQFLEEEYEQRKIEAKEQLNYTKDMQEIDRALRKLDLIPLEKLINEKGVIKAPVSGYVSELNISLGEICSTLPVMSISNKEGGYTYNCEVKEEDKEVLNIGDKMMLTDKKGDSVGENPVIVSINPSKEKENTYVVTAHLEGDFAPVLHKTIKMKVESKTEAFPMCVPLSALRRDSSYYVLVIRETRGVLGEELRAERVDVNLIEKTDKIAAISAPLGEGDLVIIESSKPVNAGDRVRPRS